MTGSVNAPRRDDETPVVDDRVARRARAAFYGVVVGIALIGNATASWGSAGDLTWLPGWVKWTVHVFAAAALELGGVTLAMNADIRRRKNERALTWMTASAAVAGLAMAVNLLGHWSEPIFAAVFTGFSVLGYCVYLLASAAGRRDQLRAEGKLPPTAPHYPLDMRRRDRDLYKRARWLALEHRLGLYDSIAAAKEELRQEASRAALKVALKEYLAKGAEPGKQAIALATYDLDLIVEEMRTQADNAGVARALADELMPARMAEKARAVERAAERAKGAPSNTAVRASGAPPKRARTPRAARNERAANTWWTAARARAYAEYAARLDAGQGEMTDEELRAMGVARSKGSVRVIRANKLRVRYAQEVADGARHPSDVSALPPVVQGKITAHSMRELSGELRIVGGGGEG